LQLQLIETMGAADDEAALLARFKALTAPTALPVQSSDPEGDEQQISDADVNAASSRSGPTRTMADISLHTGGFLPSIIFTDRSS
jgi:hypothetical protein